MKACENKTETGDVGKYSQRCVKENFKKKRILSTKSTLHMHSLSINEKKRDCFFVKVPNFDSRKFPLVSKSPEPEARKNCILNKINKKNESSSPKKLTIAQIQNKKDPNLIFYGKISNKKLPKLTRPPVVRNPNSSFIQENIANFKIPYQYKKFSEMFQNKISNFYENESKTIQKIAEISYFYDPNNLQACKITQSESLQIVNEYQKPVNMRNYCDLDLILQKNSFFSRFSKEIRMKLLEISTPIEYNCGEIIFNEGDSGDDMYAIIRGSIDMKKVDPDCRNQMLSIASLYDGRYFGELSLAPEEINEIKGFRSTTCVASEKTLIFAMSKMLYNQILLKQLENDLNKKILFLSQLEIFKNIDPYVLIPLATNLESIVFENNQKIIEKGEVPKGLYVIIKGFAVAVTEGVRINKNEENSGKNYEITKKDSEIFYSKTDHKIKNNNEIRNRKMKSKEALINKYIMTANSNTWKNILEFVCEQDKNFDGKEKNLEKERIEYSILKSKDYFGGRFLYKSLKYFDNNIRPAKFSIVISNKVAHSAKVEVFIIKPWHLSFLTDKVKLQVLNLLEKSYEIDSPSDVDIDAIDKFFEEWVKYKQKMVKEIQNASLTEKKSKTSWM